MRIGKIARALLFIVLLPVALAVDFDTGEWDKTGVLSSAEARLGRPATPASVAGVARRTTRRSVRRTTAYIATLPPGCPRVYVNSMPYYSCGGAYYEASGGGYVVVIIN